MKFTIEVIRAAEGEREEVLYRSTGDEISPRRAKTKADQLVKIWGKRGGISVRVLNHWARRLYIAK
jgi:hypothetical protein